MDFNTKYHGDLCIVTLLADRLDAARAVQFKEGLKTIADDAVYAMLLDLSQVQFLDSSGLGALVAHLKYMGVERRFELCSLAPSVAKVFKLTRMDSVFKIYPNLETALQSNSTFAEG